MKAYLFVGQGAQFEGMGKELYDESEIARQLMEEANDVLGFELSKVMIEGSEEDLRQTRVTQPALFVHSLATMATKSETFQPDMAAGHSLGEFSALTAIGALSFEDGLRLVQQRAEAMQQACEQQPGTMAAVIGMADEQVEQICEQTEGIVMAANYNCPGQLVISGEVAAVESAVKSLQEAGARRAILLAVGGAFHSPLMEPARKQLEAAIQGTNFKEPRCPIYQNVNPQPETDPDRIKSNLIEQLTAPVRWTQTLQNMIADGASHFVEVGGTGKVLQGMLRRVSREVTSETM